MHRRDVDEFERRAKGARSAPAAWLSKAWLAEWLKVLPQFHPAHGTTADDPSPMSEAYWSDTFCPHSRLSSNKLTRKLINEAVKGPTGYTTTMRVEMANTIIDDACLIVVICSPL